MSKFYQNRRRGGSRYRREIQDHSKRNLLNEDPVNATLGKRLAAFKAQPDSELQQRFNLFRSRPLFIGACSKCTVHSGATFFPDSIYNYSALEDGLDHELQPAKCLGAAIDFTNSIKKNDFVAASNVEEKEVNKVIESQNLENSTFSRLWLWIIAKILRLLFPRGIFYHPGQLEVLDRCSLSKIPFLFLPVHKSDMDEAVFQVALSMTKNRLDCSTFYARRHPSGSSSPGKGFVLQNHEDWSSQDVVWAVQQGLVATIFENNCHLMSFLEPSPGVRPNLALDKDVLDHALECMYGEKLEDIQIVPVGISYEVPHPKWPVNLWDVCKIWLGVMPNYGCARVDFDQPFSLQEYLSKIGDLSHEDAKERLATHVMKTSWDSCRIMPSEVVAFFRKYKKSPSPSLEQVDALAVDLSGRSHIGFSFPFIKGPAIRNDHVDDLAWALAFAFLREGIVAAALGSLIDTPIRSGYEGMNGDITVRRSDLLERCLVAFELLSHEYHFSLPCKGIIDEVDDTIELLKLKEIIRVVEEAKSENFQENWSRKMAQRLEREMIQDSDSEDGRHGTQAQDVVYLVCLGHKAVDEFVFLYELARPLFEAYDKVLKCLDNQNSDAIEISQICLQTHLTLDQVNRVINRLLQMEAVRRGADDYLLLNVQSLSGLRKEVQLFLK